MQAIKLVVGVTPTCWRPPFGDVDDRIRSIANALGLRTILWKHDSFDWQAGQGGVTTDTVDGNYQSLVNDAIDGSFANAGAIMLTHELNNFTMSEAIKFYDQLADAFENIVPVGVAYNITQPYVETNYSQPAFEEYINSQSHQHQHSTESQTTSAALVISPHFPALTIVLGAVFYLFDSILMIC
ncbi:hypothetical protein VKT23_008477 [Stygiomarasmius scandens]|uniref:chitin deacetylase n=1 Tax=Marasmiellus scandens TaxID=2682957 RepID=A0ABR1JJC6_9AGAR